MVFFRLAALVSAFLLSSPLLSNPLGSEPAQLASASAQPAPPEAPASTRRPDSFGSVSFGYMGTNLACCSDKVLAVKAVAAQVWQWLQSHPDAQFTVHGYADIGLNEANARRFAEQRARSLREQLLVWGIPEDRLNIEAHAVAVNSLAEGEQYRKAEVR